MENKIKANAPKGSTHYKEYEGTDLIAYYRVSFIEIDGYPSIKEQFLWYHEKWVYCTPLTGNYKPL